MSFLSVYIIVVSQRSCLTKMSWIHSWDHVDLKYFFVGFFQIKVTECFLLWLVRCGTGYHHQFKSSISRIWTGVCSSATFPHTTGVNLNIRVGSTFAVPVLTVTPIYKYRQQCVSSSLIIRSLVNININRCFYLTLDSI